MWCSCALTAWLRQILARNVTDQARRFKLAQARRADRERPLEDQLGQTSRVLGQMVADSIATPSQVLRDRELAVIIADALGELNEDQCEVVILRGLMQHSWEEVAARMKRTPGAVRMLWSRTLTRLKPLIESRI